jgi:hypothetical protein
MLQVGRGQELERGRQAWWGGSYVGRRRGANVDPHKEEEAVLHSDDEHSDNGHENCLENLRSRSKLMLLGKSQI